MSPSAASQLERLLAVMARLRDPDGGCPWDLEQDFASIAPYTIEEAYEVDDAIQRGDWDDLRDELGDLLLQVVFHAQMAREQERFDFEDVARGICEKLVRRHPHVFGEARVASARDQSEAWEGHKARERAARGGTSAFDGLPRGLPALLRARKLLSRAARTGAAASGHADPWAAVARELEALRAPTDSADARSDAVGELLLAVTELARRLEVDPEDALRRATRRFETEARRREG